MTYTVTPCFDWARLRPDPDDAVILRARVPASISIAGRKIDRAIRADEVAQLPDVVGDGAQVIAFPQFFALQPEKNP